VKALSVRQPWAYLIATGKKTVECRSWRTDYRGPLLICASGRAVIYEDERLEAGNALCIVELVDVRPFLKKHCTMACMKYAPDPGSWAWMFQKAILIDPFPVKGKLHIFEVGL
jgi:hypothetical protein